MSDYEDDQFEQVDNAEKSLLKLMIDLRAVKDLK